jgi:hypothetical protein
MLQAMSAPRASDRFARRPDDQTLAATANGAGRHSSVTRDGTWSPRLCCYPWQPPENHWD